MNRIQLTVLSLLLLPGLANCNNGGSHPAQDTSRNGGTFTPAKGEPGEKGPSGDKGPPGDKGGTAFEPEIGKVQPVKDGTITKRPGGFDVQLQKDVLEVRAAASNALRVHFLPEGEAAAPTRVIDPNFKSDAVHELTIHSNGKGADLKTGQFTGTWDPAEREITVKDTTNKAVMWLQTDELRKGSVAVEHDFNDRLYGIGGSGRSDHSGGVLCNWKEELKTGDQGHAGAPLVWSTAGYGVLVDTMGSRDRKIELNQPNHIVFKDTSKKDVDAYLLVGRSAELFGAVAKISGRTPLFPKWAMGFTNSQWGADNGWSDKRNGNGELTGMTEAKFREIIQRYRKNKIPIDAFTFDLDWMFWGGANGNGVKIPGAQFTWNTERFPGMKPGASQHPDQNMRMFAEQQGIKLTAILKPRMPVESEEGRMFTQKRYWMPNTPVNKDFFTETMMRHVDFSRPAVRTWYADHVKSAFETGIQGWWNDEADSSEATDNGNESQGIDMQRAVYEGQRGYSNQRVWSINRNFYLGAQRYAYGLWSGDIDNGFDSMKIQRQRMLSAINAGAMQWTMDSGGFNNRTVNGRKIGTQYEDYARWLQFAIFTPIFRVHAENGNQRQPWWYVPPGQTTAEAAIEAIRLRYKFIPYIYSYEHQRNKTGVGIVRPLLFDWPEDQNVRDNVDSWLFGDWLLTSPVVEQGQQNKEIYLPAGSWTEWNSGRSHQGGQKINFSTQKWESNFPLFIRQGAIIRC